MMVPWLAAGLLWALGIYVVWEMRHPDPLYDRLDVAMTILWPLTALAFMAFRIWDVALRSLRP